MPLGPSSKGQNKARGFRGNFLFPKRLQLPILALFIFIHLSCVWIFTYFHTCSVFNCVAETTQDGFLETKPQNRNSPFLQATLC